MDSINLLKSLIDTTIAHLKYYEDTMFRNYESPYVPSYLIEPREMEKRVRVERGLEAFKEIITNLQNYQKYVPSQQQDVGTYFLPVFIALLYIAMEDRYQNYYEYLAYRKLETYEKEIQGILSSIKGKIGLGDNNPGDKLKLIEYLVLYHKIADRVRYHRLSEEVYKRILNDVTQNRLLVGIMAASCYNSSGELYDIAQRKEMVQKIIEGWGEETYYTDSNKEYTDEYTKIRTYNKNVIHLDVLWDYPLSNLHDSLGRGTLNGEKFKALCQFLDPTPKNGEIGHCYTFNYFQSRRTLFALYDLFLIHYSKERFEEYFEIIKDEKSEVREIRLKEEKALPILLGQIDVPDLLRKRETQSPPDNTAYKSAIDTLSKQFKEFSTSSFDWLQYIVNIIKSEIPKKGENSEYFPIPLAEYFPMPLLVNYFHYATTYHKDLLVKITYEVTGQVDRYFKRYCSVVIPRPDKLDLDKSLKFTIEKLLASYATNIGICAGYDHIQLFSENKDLVHSIRDILHEKKSGYELLLRYIEAYMRSHDVYAEDTTKINVEKYWEEFQKPLSLEENGYAVGIDVGATAIKYRIYQIKMNTFEMYGNEYRTSIKKNSSDDTIKYTSLDDFSEKLIKDIKTLLKKADPPLDFNTLKFIGICWPSPIREQKIAGASGIMKNFEKKVASHLIRENTVDQIRALDLIGALKKIKDLKNIEIGLVKDGYAEALGRLMEDGNLLFPPLLQAKIEKIKPKWAILKLGTGTAGAIFTYDRIYDGPTEFGKLVLNVYIEGKKEKHDLGDENKFPSGTLNEYASAKLLPNVYKEVTGIGDVTSYEIGRIGEYYFKDLRFNGITTSKISHLTESLVEDIGLDFVYNHFFSHIRPKPPKPKDLYQLPCVEKGIILDVLKIPNPDDLKEYIKRKGRERLAIVLGFGNVQDSDVEKRIEQGTPAKIEETFNKAGSLLADAIMLLYEYYSIHGVIICGGVFSNTSGIKMLESIKVHLKKKYFVDFQDIGEYLKDLQQYDKLGKKHLTTIYYLVNFDVEPIKDEKVYKDVGIKMDINKISDRGDLGALYHAVITSRLRK